MVYTELPVFWFIFFFLFPLLVPHAFELASIAD